MFFGNKPEGQYITYIIWSPADQLWWDPINLYSWSGLNLIKSHFYWILSDLGQILIKIWSNSIWVTCWCRVDALWATSASLPSTTIIFPCNLFKAFLTFFQISNSSQDKCYTFQMLPFSLYNLILFLSKISDFISLHFNSSVAFSDFLTTFPMLLLQVYMLFVS